MKPAGRPTFAANAPLPMRDGVAASRVYLPAGPWQTLDAFLSERFPQVPAEVLAARLQRGDIVDQAGIPQGGDDAYVPFRWLWYYREVADEPPIPFDLPLLYRDELLVVVDKPHFLASIPGGRHLHETALTRLRKSLNLPLLSPIHRLDRDTAGVLMFCIDPAYRGAYQVLFQLQRVQKEYEAIAPLSTGLQFPRVHRSRLMPVPERFTVHEVEGKANSATEMELVGRAPNVDGMGLYRLRPSTGRKHQLRAHMSALGIPIRNDMLYPKLLAYPDVDDFARPLQLLARSIEFVDPVTGIDRRFCSRRVLQAGAPDEPPPKLPSSDRNTIGSDRGRGSSSAPASTECGLSAD